MRCVCGHPWMEHNFPLANYYSKDLIEGACLDESNNFDFCHEFRAAE